MSPVPEIRFYRATGPHGFLSNLFPCSVLFEDRTFRNAEEAYQYGKPAKREVAEWIVSAPTPTLCAQAAHALFVWQVRPDWGAVKVVRMGQVLRAKFSQHPDLLQELLDTGDAALVEESTMDAFWGIGKKGTGKNMLGQLLMGLRSEFRQ